MITAPHQAPGKVWGRNKTANTVLAVFFLLPGREGHMQHAVPHILRLVKAAKEKGRDTARVSHNGSKLLRKVYGENGFTEVSPGVFRIHLRVFLQ